MYKKTLRIFQRQIDRIEGKLIISAIIKMRAEYEELKKNYSDLIHENTEWKAKCKALTKKTLSPNQFLEEHNNLLKFYEFLDLQSLDRYTNI